MSRHELIAQAKVAAALHGGQHAYTQGANFEPHGWVIEAMAEAYNAGSSAEHDTVRNESYQEGYREGYDDGYAQAEADHDD